MKPSDLAGQRLRHARQEHVRRFQETYLDAVEDVALIYDAMHERIEQPSTPESLAMLTLAVVMLTPEKDDDYA